MSKERLLKITYVFKEFPKCYTLSYELNTYQFSYFGKADIVPFFSISFNR